MKHQEQYLKEVLFFAIKDKDPKAFKKLIQNHNEPFKLKSYISNFINNNYSFSKNDKYYNILVPYIIPFKNKPSIKEYIENLVIVFYNYYLDNIGDIRYVSNSYIFDISEAEFHKIIKKFIGKYVRL